MINDDEFWGGVWWIANPDAPGTLRPATGREAADEIRRLRAELAQARRILTDEEANV